MNRIEIETWLENNGFVYEKQFFNKYVYTRLQEEYSMTIIREESLNRDIYLWEAYAIDVLHDEYKIDTISNNISIAEIYSKDTISNIISIAEIYFKDISRNRIINDLLLPD